MINYSARELGSYKYANRALVGYFLQFVDFLDRKLETRLMLEDRSREVLWEDEISPLVGDLAQEITAIGNAAREQHPELSEQAMQNLMFVMSAWGDEVLIKSYRNAMIPEQHGGLERRLFGTTNAGEQFFNKAKHLIDRGGREDVCLAAVFLTALTLGFEGRYIGGGVSDDLQRIVRDLRMLALDRADVEQTIVPGRTPTRTLPSVWNRSLRTGLAVFLASGVLAIGTLAVVWTIATQPLVTFLDELPDIQDAAQRKQLVVHHD